MRAMLLAACATACLGPGAGASAASLQLGINEPELGYTDAPTALAAGLRSSGTDLVRISLRWDEVEPSAPNARNAVNPDWSGAFYKRVDQAVRLAAAANAKPVLVLANPPAWVEGSGRPADVSGPWKPRVKALAQFATSLAKRYSGRFVPRGAHRRLPAVRYWQVWNEPNFPSELSPQFAGSGRKAALVSPELYRGLLNGAYTALKGVSRRNRVVLAAPAPFGDHPLNSYLHRIPPLTFLARLLCVDGRRCAARAHFDIASFNAYPPSPAVSAFWSTDLYLADAPKVRRLLSRAVARRTVAPSARKPLWVTEFSWSTGGTPAVSAPTQAAFLAESLKILSDDGVSAAFWYRLRDSPNPGGFMEESGLYSRAASPADDTPKPALAAFQFPFVATRAGRQVSVWGMAPRNGRVVIQVSDNGTWKTVHALKAAVGGIFSGRLRLAPGTVVRAKAGSAASPPGTP